MGEFSGYKCDGPNCSNTVDKKSDEARKWLLVKVSTDGYNEQFTFCSYECFEGYVHVTRQSQGAAFEP